MADFEKSGERHGNAVGRWWYHDAKWWQFWYPQSGPIGAGVFGAILFGITFLYGGLR